MKNFTSTLRTLLYVLLCFLGYGVHAQVEYILNPGFESGTSNRCSYTSSKAAFDGSTTNWTGANNASPDLYNPFVSNTCYSKSTNSTNTWSVGNQAANEGSYYAGIFLYGQSGGGDYREYIQTQLLGPMVIGASYTISLWVSLADKSNFACNNFGMLFSTKERYQADNFVLSGVTPQYVHPTIMTNKSGWSQITATIVADSSYTHLMIGNFSDDASTSTSFNTSSTYLDDDAHYYIDGVSVDGPPPSLPVILLEFTHEVIDNDVVLNWVTSTENGNDHFVVERSDNGIDYEFLELVDGFGYSNTTNEYEVIDHDPYIGESYYRLTQFDKAGQKEVFEPIRVFKGVDLNASVFPNPQIKGNSIIVQLAQNRSDILQFEIVDLTGRQIRKEQITKDVLVQGFEIDTKEIPAGIYMYQLTGSNVNQTGRIQIIQ